MSTPTTTPSSQGEFAAAIQAGIDLQSARHELKVIEIGLAKAALVPKDMLIASLEKAFGTPARKRGVTTLLDIDSFIRFFNEHKTEDSRVFTKEGRFVGILDYHNTEIDGQAWCDFRALFNSTYSEQWKIWDAWNGKWMQQKPFAEFIEENALDVTSPPSADMLEISRTLEAKKDVNFKQAVRLDNGDSTLIYEEITQAKAGARGELEVPNVFTLAIPVFNGMVERPILCRFKFSIDDGRARFMYQVVRRSEVLADAAAELIVLVNDACKVKCYLAEEPLVAIPLNLG